jgi:hypothetical protein
VVIRIKLAGYQARSQATIGSTNFVGTGRKVFADKTYDAGFDSGKRGRYLQVVHITEETGRYIVFPIDPEEINRIDYPKARWAGA